MAVEYKRFACAVYIIIVCVGVKKKKKEIVIGTDTSTYNTFIVLYYNIAQTMILEFPLPKYLPITIVLRKDESEEEAAAAASRFGGNIV